MNEETKGKTNKEISIWQKITKQPKCIDKKKDLWIFYCSHCHRWYKGTRHGYSSTFIGQMYFECDNGHKTEAPGWWK